VTQRSDQRGTIAAVVDSKRYVSRRSFPIARIEKNSITQEESSGGPLLSSEA
jgi:hypothetical protein